MAPQLKRLIDGPVADAVREYAIVHSEWSPSQVHRELEREYGRDVPSLRTVQRFLAEFRTTDNTERWTIKDGEPDSLPVVLTVVQWLARGTWPPSTWPSRAVAEWIVRLARAYGDSLKPDVQYRLGQAAVRGDLDDVQAYLAHTPWIDSGEHLFWAVVNGRVPERVVTRFGGPGFTQYFRQWRDDHADDIELQESSDDTR